jgi:type II secretory pathway pseudopilin PulG
MVSSSRNSRPIHAAAAFSLIEMAAVLAIVTTLMTAGVSLLNGSATQARHTGTDRLTGLIEQARTSAITSRTNILLAVAEPWDLAGGGGRSQLGLFRIDEEWPDAPAVSGSLECTLLSRWQPLPTGIVLLPGDVDGIPNPLNQPELLLAYGGTKNLTIKVHAIVFSSRGSLHYPPGSAPIVMRITEGAYRGGKATPNLNAGQKHPTESLLKIGRITSRPYRIDR